MHPFYLNDDANIRSPLRWLGWLIVASAVRSTPIQ